MNKKVSLSFLLCLISNLAVGMRQQTSQENLSIVKRRNFENKKEFKRLFGFASATEYISSCSAIQDNCQLHLTNDKAFVIDNNQHEIPLPGLAPHAVNSLHRIGQLANAMDQRKKTSWLSEKIIVTGSSGTRYSITEIIDTTTDIKLKHALINTDTNVSFPAHITVHKNTQLSWVGKITQAYKDGNLSISYLKEGEPAIKLINRHTLVISEADVKVLQQAFANNAPFYIRIFGPNGMVVYQITKFLREKSEKLEPNLADDKSQTQINHPKLSESTFFRKTIMAFVVGIGAGMSGFLIFKYTDRLFDTHWLNAFLNKMYGYNLNTKM